MTVRLVLAAALCTALAACAGGDEAPMTKAEYEREAYSIVEGLGGEASRLYSAIVIGFGSRDECKDDTTRFHEVLGEIVARVEHLRPPEEVEELHRAFLIHARESVAEVGRAAEDVRRGEIACGFDLNRRIYGLPSTERAEEVLSEYQELGYFPYLFGQ